MWAWLGWARVERVGASSGRWARASGRARRTVSLGRTQAFAGRAESGAVGALWLGEELVVGGGA